jgi:co-chaperonin GroES (HSP10)
MTDSNKLAYAAHQLLKHQIKPLNNSVIVSDMVFDQRITSGGIVLLSDNGKSTGIRPRWAQVYAVGPDQQDVKPGDWVCVAHGRWTRGTDVEDETGKKTLRRVDPNDIMLISDEQPQDDTFSSAIHVEAKPSYMQHT